MHVMEHEYFVNGLTETALTTLWVVWPSSFAVCMHARLVHAPWLWLSATVFVWAPPWLTGWWTRLGQCSTSCSPMCTFTPTQSRERRQRSELDHHSQVQSLHLAAGYTNDSVQFPVWDSEDMPFISLTTFQEWCRGELVMHDVHKA